MDKGRTAAGLAGGCTPPPFLIWYNVFFNKRVR
jgi:hypothetical protein